MLFTAFRSLSKQLVTIALILLLCALIAWAIDGRAAAIALLNTSAVRMNGLMVWTFGVGLATFIATEGRRLPVNLLEVLEPSDATAAAVARLELSTRHRRAWRYTLPITAIGAVLTAAYGVPNPGAAGVMVFVGVCAIYYTGGFLLYHFVEVTSAFHALFESMDRVEFRQLYSPLSLENVTNYLALTTALGLAGIYAGFRGTITAGFQFPQELWRAFLWAPVVLFLPGTLFYNYYPRYVLRKIIQHKVFRAMERLGSVTEQGARELLLSLRENSVLSSQILPFLDYKSLPSYLLAVFFGLSVAFNSDPAVRSFVKAIFGVAQR